MTRPKESVALCAGTQVLVCKVHSWVLNKLQKNRVDVPFPFLASISLTCAFYCTPDKSANGYADTYAHCFLRFHFLGGCTKGT